MDTYSFTFAALAVFIFLRLRSVLGQRTGSERPSYLTEILLTLTAVALCAVFFDVGRANWYRTISGPARVIDVYSAVVLLLFYCILELLWWLWLDKKHRNGRPRYLTGILLSLTTVALGAVVAYEANWYSAVIALWRRTNIAWHDPDLYFSLALLAAITALVAIIEESRSRKPGWWKRAKPLDGLLRDHPSQRKAVDPGIEREFNNAFMTTSKEGKQALIKRWMDRKECDREEAMRLAIEELRRDNR